MADWQELWEELDAWHHGGRIATLWWRDDDATRATPALERLLALSEETQTPVALAVIPATADGSLDRALARHSLAVATQHGWSHANHAPADERQEEYGPHRPREVMLAELAEGRRRIAALPRSLPVLVAPWNRMDEALLPALPEVGIRGVSTLGPRPAAERAPGVRQVNVHVDLIDWHGSGGFIGEAAALGQLVSHLRARRRGAVDGDEASGVMSHHPFHDEGCWQFLGELFERSRAHPAVRWLAAREAFSR